MSRRARYALPIVLVLVLVLGWAVWPHGIKLVPYTSPPIPWGAKSVRLSGMVPAGWVEEAFLKPGKGGIHGNGIFLPSIHFRPPRPPRWMPGWLFRLLHGTVEKDADLTLMSDDPRAGEFGGRDDYGKLELMPETGNARVAYLWVKGGPGYMIMYIRTNHPAFEATYRRICESFRVIE